MYKENLLPLFLRQLRNLKGIRKTSAKWVQILMQSKILRNTKSLSNNRLYKVRSLGSHSQVQPLHGNHDQVLKTKSSFPKTDRSLIWADSTTFIQLKSLIKISKFKILQVHLGLRKFHQNSKTLQVQKNLEKFQQNSKFLQVQKNLEEFQKSFKIFLSQKKVSIYLSLLQNIEQKKVSKKRRRTTGTTFLNLHTSPPSICN